MKVTIRDIILVNVAALMGLYGTELSILFTGQPHDNWFIMTMLLGCTVVLLYMIIPFIELSIYYGIVMNLLKDCSVTIEGKTQQEEDEINNIISEGYLSRQSHEETVTAVAEHIRSGYGKS
jgi:hypothetical protein